MLLVGMLHEQAHCPMYPMTMFKRPKMADKIMEREAIKHMMAPIALRCMHARLDDLDDAGKCLIESKNQVVEAEQSSTLMVAAIPCLLSHLSTCLLSHLSHICLNQLGCNSACTRQISSSIEFACCPVHMPPRIAIRVAVQAADVESSKSWYAAVIA